MDLLSDLTDELNLDFEESTAMRIADRYDPFLQFRNEGGCECLYVRHLKHLPKDERDYMITTAYRVYYNYIKVNAPTFKFLN